MPKLMRIKFNKYYFYFSNKKQKLNERPIICFDSITTVHLNNLLKTESHLTDILNKSIQQLNIDNDRIIQPLATTNYIYFLNVMHINFNFHDQLQLNILLKNPTNKIFIHNLLSSLIPYIQLFMKFRTEFFNAYQWTKSINISSLLMSIQFIIVDYLQLIYRFKNLIHLFV
ncbi:unnamed protein product [Rotaria sp. Silwood1]|nr:unnamed protein product [Rotaria sp. Silwood1]CAF1654931.1 unnamed protein product [Rotaria sp. Silwood1]